MLNAFTRTSDALSRLFGLVSMLLLAAAVLVICQMVFLRYVMNASTVWQTEFVVYALIAATFLGAPYVLLHRGHVAVDLLPNLLAGTRAGRLLQLLAGLLAIAFCATVAWSGWGSFHEALVRGWKTETVWAIPLWIPLLPLPLGMGMLCIQYLAELLRRPAARPAERG